MNLDEYYKTTREEKLIFQIPEHMEDHLTSATRLLEKIQEFSEIEQALETKKEDFEMRMEHLQQRRAELERKESQLKESLEKFNKILQENIVKKNHAIKKANNERDFKKTKDKDIARLQTECENLKQVFNRKKKRHDSYMILVSFLMKVLTKTDEFNEIRDIIKRYDALSSTYNDLVEMDTKTQKHIEYIRHSDTRNTEEKHNEILGYNNQLSVLQLEIKKQVRNALHWESKWNHIQNTATKEALTLGRIKIVTLNLVNVIKGYKGQAPTDDTTTLQQLNYIKIFGEDLSKTVQSILNGEQDETAGTMSVEAKKKTQPK